MTRIMPLTPPQGVSDKGRKKTVCRSPSRAMREKEAGVSTRGREEGTTTRWHEQEQRVKKKAVVGRKTTGKKKKIVTHKSMRVRPNLGPSRAFKAGGNTKKRKLPTP
jgi:hypothetical protein